MSNHYGDERPQHPVHTSSPSVAVYVGQQYVTAEYDSGDQTNKSSDWGRGSIFLNRQQGREEDLLNHYKCYGS
jgi:hypothetical protein